MSRYIDHSDFSHERSLRCGVLLVNLGTPQAPTKSALRRYLGEFLWDPRLVEIPRPIWWLILHGIILRLRPARSAHAYAKIWREQGSPLCIYSEEIAAALQARLGDAVKVQLAMRYGQPSIARSLQALFAQGVRRLVVLPLYPQYSATTTASVFDAVSKELQRYRWLPALQFISHYHDFPPYIHAMAQQIEAHWKQHGRGTKLLFSFHGIPKRFFLNGDPYYCECQKTARLLATALQLPDDQWQVVFQSRFGRAEWLQPYLDETLRALPEQGVKKIDIFCPGFAADCLETLEEIAMQNREVFMAAGGEAYCYIPALNAAPAHIDALQALLQMPLQAPYEPATAGPARRQRAQQLGAPR